MLRALRWFEARVLPRGWMDLMRQLALFLGAYFLYSIVRLAVHGGAYNPGYRPFGDAMRIIDVERVLHVFVEPSIQEWALDKHWLIDGADWIYLNAHLFVTIGVLAWIYTRHNRSFYFVRNTFLIAMVIALVAYWLYPTAPPRLMPEWGFSDAVKQFTGITVEKGPSSEVLNLYAAVPSMHVCFAIMLGWPAAKLTRRRPIKIAWALYPLLITFVVIVTGNHYFMDVFLGAFTAGISALLAQRVLPRFGPAKWALDEAPA
jgi:membrane-associated phospholipid phosphatase